MRVTTSFICSTLITLACAQTPGNFSVQSSASLNVIFQPGAVNVIPGGLLPQSDVVNSPSIYAPQGEASSTFVAFMIDPTTNKGNFLHWFQPNLVSDSSGLLSFDATVTNASTAVGAKYVAPQPPNDNYAHQYVILLYQQPSNWAVPTNYSTYNPPASLADRFGFDMLNFQNSARLSAPVGTDYFRVQNTTGSAMSSAASSSTSTASSASSSGATSTTGSTTGTTSASHSASATGNSAATNGMAQFLMAGAFAVPLLL